MPISQRRSSEGSEGTLGARAGEGENGRFILILTRPARCSDETVFSTKETRVKSKEIEKEL
jgi:hypothetical protein